MKVLKFGGTSLSGAARIARVAEIITQRADSEPCVVVVSALAGITDALEAAITRAQDQAELDQNLTDTLITRHLDCIRQLTDSAGTQPYVARLSSAIGKLESMLRGIAQLGECPATTRDRILATGERLSAPLLSAALESRGAVTRVVDGCELIAIDRHWPGAVDLTETARRSRAALAPGSDSEIAVITGFLASDGSGCTATLGRGGSDYSATLLAAVLSAEAVEIWTDVDGVLSADPDHVPEAVNLPHLTYEEAGRLAGLGARVLHPKTLEPVQGRGIPVTIRNTLRPEHPGTVIDGQPQDRPTQAVTAVSEAVRFVLRPNRTLHTLDLPADVGLSEPPLQLSWDTPGRNVSLLVRAEQAASIERAIRRPRGTGGHFELAARQAIALVAVLGPVRAYPGLLDLLARGRIDVHGLHLPGGPDGTLSILVDRTDVRRAVRLLHDALSGSAPCSVESDAATTLDVRGGIQPHDIARSPGLRARMVT